MISPPFQRPTEFLPVEYTGIRGIEQKMYKEQEGLLKKSHTEIEETYIDHCAALEMHDAVFFPARVCNSLQIIVL